MTILDGLPHHIYAFAAILAVLLLGFIFFFLLRPFIVSRQPSKVTARLAELKGVPAKAPLWNKTWRAAGATAEAHPYCRTVILTAASCYSILSPGYSFNLLATAKPANAMNISEQASKNPAR